jgi:hypothetical protein
VRVGAPTAIDGDRREKQADGHWLGMLCPARIQTRQPQRAYDGGRAHDACHKKKMRHPDWDGFAETTAPPHAVVAPVRNHKKRGQSSEPRPGQHSTSNALLLLDLQRTFTTHGWWLHPPSLVSAGLSFRWSCLYERTRDTPEAWFSLRGNAFQLDARKPLASLGAEQHRLSLLGPTVAAFRRLLQGDGVRTAGLHIAALKLLRSAPGQGKQLVHYDTTRYEDAVQRFAVLMYCTETMSTAVPKLDAATMRPAFHDTEEPTEEQQAVADALCAEDNFLSFPVLPGATLVFPTSTPHFGVRNPASVDRVALYALFSPSDESGQDDTQRFPLGVTDD